MADDDTSTEDTAPLPTPKPTPAPAAPTLPAPAYTAKPSWFNGAEQAASSQGVNSDTLWRISGIESGFGKNISASTSSAYGPWQITSGTWDALAKQNPSLGLTNRSDLSQHGRAAAALLKANANVLRHALGREPTDGEQYLTWFGGVGAGPKVATASADTPVTAIFSPAAIAANRSILGNGMTAGGLRAWADAKMAGQKYVPGPNDYKKNLSDPSSDPLSNSSSGGVNWNTLNPSMPQTESEKALLDYQKNQDVWSNTHAMAEAFDHENMVGQLWRAANVPTPDPNYTPSVAAFSKDPRLADIDKSHYAYLMGSQSDAELTQRVGALKDELNYQQKMSEKGWGGSSMQVIASLMDPAGVALGMLSPVGATAAKFGRIAQVIGAGAEGAAISTGMEYAAPKPGETEHSYLGAAAMGFLGGTVGGGLGAVMHPHPDNLSAFKLMGDSAQSTLDDIAAGQSRPWGSSAGAAQNFDHVAPVRTDTDLFTNKPFMDAELGKAALPKARMDLSGQTKASENPLTAALGSRFVEDAVGNADHSAVNRAVSVEANLIKNREETFAARAYQDHWNDYRQRNNIPVWRNGAAELEFREHAADAIDNPDPTRAHDIDPAIQGVADTYRKFFADYHDLAVNPGKVDGSEMKPLRGMENVQQDASYFPRIYDFLGFGEHVRKYGDSQMQGLLRDSAMSVNPDLTREDATALAGGLYKGLRNAQTGQEVSMSRMLSGEDQDGLRAFLGSETDMNREQIERIIGHLNPPPETGTMARTKRKASLNVHYEAQLRDMKTGEVSPVKIKDFTERNVVHVASLYGRQMSGQIALARLRIENPMFREPEMVAVPRGPAFAPGEYGPVQDGHIRYFHGSKDGGGVGENGGRYVTPDYEYARDFRATEGKPNTVHYVDVKKEDAITHGGWDETNGYSQHFEAPEHIAKQLQPYGPKDRLATIPRDPKWKMPTETLDAEGNFIPRDVDPLRSAMKQLHTEAQHTKNVPANLEDVRKVLGNYTREEQDAMLLGAIHEKDFGLSSIAYNKGITPEMKAAAFAPAGDDFHLLRHQGPYHDEATIRRAEEAAKPPEMVRGEEDPANPRYLVDGIRGPSEMQTLLKRVKAVGDELGQHPDKTAKDVDRLQFMFDALSGGSTSALDRGKVGQFIRLLKAWNFTRVMNQVGFAQLAETWTGVSQVGLRAALSGMPELRQFFDGIRGGRGQTDLAMQIEHIAEAGTEMLRGSMHVPLDDLGNRVGAGASRMDAAERLLNRATRATSIMSGMAPLTAFQSKWMAKAAMARFAMDATGEKALNAKRMAVLGIDPEMAGRIRDSLQKHDGFVEGESGTKHRLLNLDKWDPDVRHAYEYALHLWVRKMIQENDLGQMNTVLGTSMGRLMGQFRMFMMAAYTKNTLHNLHMRDWETTSGVLGSTVLAGATYAARTHLNSLGRGDRDQYLAKRLDNKSVAAAAVQGGAFSSIMPMLADLGTYALGFDPLFDSRVTGTPAQGLTSNPTMSLLNSALQASRGVTASARGDGAYNQQDARALQSIMPFSNLLPVVWTANSLMSGLPTQDTHKHRN